MFSKVLKGKTLLRAKSWFTNHLIFKFVVSQQYLDVLKYPWGNSHFSEDIKCSDSISAEI